MRGMSEDELKVVVATYFGTGPSVNPDSLEIELVASEPYDEKIKIKWEEHIGAKSGVARISDRDVLHLLGLPCTEGNMEKAVWVMKGVAHVEKVHLVRYGNRYLLVNPKYRR